jgi:acetolactate synthase I/II/III large subunit
MTGAEFIAKNFKDQGLKRVFTFPGGTIAPLLDALVKAGIEIVCARHEQGAGYMALAIARLTHTPQVVMVTSGPGVTNLATVIADAYFDSTPLVAITGQIGTSDLLSGRQVRQCGFQQIETISFMNSITKASYRPLATAQLEAILSDAFITANGGRPGPVVIDLPMDVQNGSLNGSSKEISKGTDKVTPISEDQIINVSKIISKAERPVILVGQGVIISEAVEELRSLAESRNIPVAMSLLGLGVVSGNSPLSLGFIGHTGNQFAAMAIYEADVLIVIGARLDVRQTGTMPDQFSPDAKIIRVDLDEQELQYSRVKCHINIHADIKGFLSRLIETIEHEPKKDFSKWHQQITHWKNAFPLTYKHNAGSVKPQQIINAVNKYSIDNKIIVTSGVGSHQQWSARHFTFDYPRRIWLTSGGHGAMGYDLPSAIGAQLANPEYLVVSFIGDGSLQMNIQELQTLIDLETPIKIFVLDNCRLGLVSQFQLLNWKSDPTTGNKVNPDFVKISRAYGVKTYRLDKEDMIDTVIQKALKYDGPVLVHCIVDQQEDVLPMLLAGQTIDKMLLPDK